DKRISPEQIAPHLEDIKAYVAAHTALDCAPQTCSLSYTEVDYLNTYQSQYLMLKYDLDGFEQLPETIEATYDVMLAELPQTTNMQLNEENWMPETLGNASSAQMIYDNAGDVRSLDLASGSLLQGIWGVVRLGVKHIVEGIDHVLF
ncbi:MAG: hypothetical protein ACFB16_18470, partial [Phormidesmis sp.]